MSHGAGRGLVSAALAAATSVTMLASGGGAALAAPHRSATAAARRAEAAIREAGRGTPAAGTITTVAGGIGGPGPGTSVSLSDANSPLGGCGQVNTVTFAAGNLYIANGAVRKVSERTGLLTTPAGTGAAGPLGTGGRAVSAPLGACGVAVDHAGNLVIADGFNRRVRVVAVTTGTFYGRAMTAGDIYTVAGNGTAGFAGDGGPATGAEFHTPSAVAVDSAGNLVVADTHYDLDPAQMGNNRVRVVAAVAGTFYGRAMTAGDIYTVAGNGAPGYSGDGGPATRAELDDPLGAGFDAAGDLLVADGFDGRIREIAH